jgi:hypothetical protein
LGVDIFVPILHGVFVGVPNYEIVDDTRVTFPEDLDTIEARLLKADDIRDIGHIDSALQLKTRLSFRCERGFIFSHHELGLLLVRVDVFATQKDALEQKDVVLANHVSGVRSPCFV